MSPHNSIVTTITNSIKKPLKQLETTSSPVTAFFVDCFLAVCFCVFEVQREKDKSVCCLISVVNQADSTL